MHICSAHAACAYMDKAGTLKWRSIKATEKPVFEMSPSDYIRIKQTNPVKSYSRVVVTYDEEDKLTYEAGTGPDSQTMFVICPYATQQITDNILAAIDGYSYQPVSITPRGFPQLDQGDRLQLEVFSSVRGKTLLSAGRMLISRGTAYRLMKRLSCIRSCGIRVASACRWRLQAYPSSRVNLL